MNKIDIRELIASKSPALARKVPDFLIRMLNRLLHIREINRILSRSGDLSGVDFLDYALDVMGVQMSVNGAENLTDLTRPVVVSNHPLGGLDGMVLLTLMSRYFSEVKALANDFLLALPALKHMFVPVNKLGGNSSNMSRYHELFSSESAILQFPAGLCSRRKGGRLADLRWNRSYVRLAREHGRPIVPVFFAGANRRRFYFLANLRRWLGIQFNIEMLFLVDEMFSQKGSMLEARIGSPVLPGELVSGDLNSWNREIRRRVYELGREDGKR